MKISILLLLFLGATFFGCSDNFDSTLVSTPTQTKNSTNAVISKRIIKSVLKDTDQAFSPLIIKSKSINGVTGGQFIIDTTYVNYQGRLLYVNARLKVKDSSFTGTVNFQMILHPEEASVELFPHMHFNKEVELSITYQGIDVKGLGFNEEEDLYFVFFNENGDVEIIDDKTASVKLDDPRIKVTNAKLSHFSRYGWIRKTF